MNRLYHNTSFHGRNKAPSSALRVIKFIILFLLAAGVFIALVLWFRRDAEEKIEVEITQDDEASDVVDVAETVEPQMITLTPIGDGALTGTVTKSHVDGIYSLAIVATLPIVDTVSEVYEIWYIKPGITDFFSLGEMFPREDGAWGLVWSETDALARVDLGEFKRILITKEVRDGDIAPSTQQILQGEFK